MNEIVILLIVLNIITLIALVVVLYKTWCMGYEAGNTLAAQKYLEEIDEIEKSLGLGKHMEFFIAISATNKRAITCKIYDHHIKRVIIDDMDENPVKYYQMLGKKE